MTVACNVCGAEHGYDTHVRIEAEQKAHSHRADRLSAAREGVVAALEGLVGHDSVAAAVAHGACRIQAQCEWCAARDALKELEEASN